MTFTLDRSQRERAMLEPAYVVRYCVTRLNEHQQRVLMGAAQGRNTFETPEAAESWLTAAMDPATNSQDIRDRYLRGAEVRAVACYPGHFDPIGIYFDSPAYDAIIRALEEGDRPARRAGMMHFYTDCVSCPGPEAGQAIQAMIDGARQITRRTFLRHVDPGEAEQIEQGLGYAAWRSRNGELRMVNDWHVGYYASTFRGRRCVYFTWSAIEHIFTEERAS